MRTKNAGPFLRLGLGFQGVRWIVAAIGPGWWMAILVDRPNTGGISLRSSRLVFLWILWPVSMPPALHSSRGFALLWVALMGMAVSLSVSTSAVASCGDYLHRHSDAPSEFPLGPSDSPCAHGKCPEPPTGSTANFSFSNDRLHSVSLDQASRPGADGLGWLRSPFSDQEPEQPVLMPAVPPPESC
jgi:hypothetical protein